MRLSGETEGIQEAASIGGDGGEGGIRTPGTLAGTAVFKTARFNRSRTSPLGQPTVYSGGGSSRPGTDRKSVV